jgi:hypothetical protein
MAARLLAHVCGDDAAKWAAAADGAERAIRARLRLWDDLVALLPANAASGAAAAVASS